MILPVAWERPAPAEVWRAIDVWLANAYDGPPPRAVAERLDKLRAAADGAFYECEAFERAGEGYALRLGNRAYPHMKLVVEASPTGGALFRADTHDRHVLELLGPASPGLEALIARNEAVARAIEAAWTMVALPTLRDYWKDELARWKATRG
jgi:hypothetical protein